MQPRVLQVGRDELLLQTRAAILDNAGIAVETCLITQSSASLRRCQERHFARGNGAAVSKTAFNAIILCHTLDQERAIAIAMEARRSAPSTKIVILGALDDLAVPASLYDLSISCCHGPATLVHALNDFFSPDTSLPTADMPLEHLSTP